MYKSVLNNNAGPIPYIEELLDYNKIEQINSGVITTNKKGVFIPYSELNYNNYWKIGNLQIIGNNSSIYKRCPWADCHFIIDSGVVIGTDYSRSTSFFIPLKNQNENIKILDVNNAVMLNDNSLTYTCPKNGVVFQGNVAFAFSILINSYKCFSTTKYAKAGDVLTWTNYKKPDYSDDKSNTFYNKSRYFIPFKN